MEGVDPVERTRVNETHEQIPDVSPVFRPIKETVLPMENGPLESLLTEIVIQGCPWNSEKQGERFPMLQHVGDGLPHGGVRLDLPFILSRFEHLVWLVYLIYLV